MINGPYLIVTLHVSLITFGFVAMFSDNCLPIFFLMVGVTNSVDLFFGYCVTKIEIMTTKPAIRRMKAFKFCLTEDASWRMTNV